MLAIQLAEAIPQWGLWVVSLVAIFVAYLVGFKLGYKRGKKG